MRRRLAGGVVLALAAAMVTGCSSDDDEPESGDEYVALGDSYTAATNTGRIEQPLDGCGRSETNYPKQVAEELGLELTDVSCNGASTRQVSGTQTRGPYTMSPQLDVVDDDTELVTMSLGGNDYAFLVRIAACAANFEGQSGAPCTQEDEALGANSVASRLPEVEGNVAGAIREVRDRAPDARIVVVGYPQPFPAEGTCDLVPIPPGDYPWARSIIQGLNEALAAAAEQEDAIYVDVATASEGHDICSDDPWVAGAKITSPATTSPWHPYANEVDAVADLVVAAVEQDQ